MSLSTRTLVVTTLTLLLVPVYTQAQTVNGYIGVFSDSTGTQNCINVPPGIPKLLYVLAKLEGTTSGGITGAEFRIEVSNPAGWTIQYYPPTAPIVIGNPLDLDPSSQSDGSGVSIVFSTCTPPDPGGLLKLGTIFVVNTGGGLNALRVKQHSVPTNPEQACALFTLCDSPTFTSQCMSAATQPPCSTILTMNSPNILSGEPMVFETSLSPESSGGFGLNASVFRSPAFPSLSSASVTDPDSDPTGALATPPNWIAQWDFNTAGSCASTFDWQAYDNRVRNDDSNRWTVNSAFDWAPGIDGDAAVLREINSCWEFPSGGYGNNWDYAIKVEYQTPPSGDLHLRFNYVVSCENLQLGAEIIAYDALSVEADSDCNSFDINFDLDETLTAERQRDLNAAAFSGLPFAAGPLATGLADAILPRYGSAGGSHCVLIRFFSDFAISHEDTDQQTGGWGLQAAAVIDNVRLELSGSPILEEDFSGALDPRVSFINSSDSEVFGNWARLFQHITDNDVCTDNTTCAWLFTDHTTPTLFNDPSMAYGPSGYVIRNWLDDVVVSPWVSLATTPDHRTVLSFREFAGNGFQTSRVVRSWSVRGQDAGGCVGSWTTEEKRRVTLDDFTWRTHLEDISSLVDPSSTQIQVRYRVTDAQFAAPDAPPAPFIPGPGSDLDDVKIGRIPSTGPVIESHRGLDTRWQAQDAFTTVPAQIGYVPAYSDRFGTCAFSPGVDNAPRLSYAPCDDPALHVPVLGDSIVVKAFIPGTSVAVGAVDWYGTIVSGPHQGKAPPPFSVNPSTGFFSVSAQHPQPTHTETRVTDLWFVDLDDDYFRGGDVLRYFWFAPQAGGQPGSLPPGIVNPNASLPVVEQNTGGIFEVNFLPTIAWDSGYRARIVADPQGGKLTPTAAELANSHQSTCILYVNKVNFNRRSGDANRTSFMSTLNRLGYRGAYDVYDLQGFGDTNNDLGGRACPRQAQGYAMIVHDSGPNTFVPLPDGSNIYTQKVNQAFWYRVYLAQANSGERGYANLWLIGENIVSSLVTNPLLTNDMGVIATNSDMSLFSVNPAIQGIDQVFDWVGSDPSNFLNDHHQLHGGCPEVRHYDGLSTASSGVVTHRFQRAAQLAEGAVVMNSHDQPDWNAVTMSFSWSDIVDGPSVTIPTPKENLARTILNHALGPECVRGEIPADAPEARAIPLVTALQQNEPNPFNPRTRIRFDIAENTRVTLAIYNIAGKLVRTLADAEMDSGSYSFDWDGKDGAGVKVASGVYLYRLQTQGFRETRKLVVLR